MLGFVKRSSSPAKTPPTHRPQQTLGKRRQTKGSRNVPSARGGFVGFVKRSSSPTKKPPTHRPQRSLSKRRQTKGPRNVPSALVTRTVLDGGLRGRWFSNTKVRLRRSTETARCRARRSSGNRDLGNGRSVSYGRNPSGTSRWLEDHGHGRGFQSPRIRVRRSDHILCHL